MRPGARDEEEQRGGVADLILLGEEDAVEGVRDRKGVVARGDDLEPLAVGVAVGVPEGGRGQGPRTWGGEGDINPFLDPRSLASRCRPEGSSPARRGRTRQKTRTLPAPGGGANEYWSLSLNPSPSKTN